MSRETTSWLNSNVLVGFEEKRGKAWHYRKSDQGSESNHYVGAVPVEDVRRRLFYWEAVEGTVESAFLTAPKKVTRITDPTRKTIIRPDLGVVLGVFRPGFELHQYDKWLLDIASNLLDSELSIGSAGLLKLGAQAWVQLELPDNDVTKHGVEFRPNLLASTSFDGTLSTTYKRTNTIVVCDNTREAALSERGQTVKIKHTKSSAKVGALNIADSREALNIVFDTGTQFAAEVDKLIETTVTDKQWADFLDAHRPVPENKGRGQTLAINERDALTELWKNDPRVAPWTGTAFGVAQAVNTFGQHIQTVRGAERSERNVSRVLSGAVAKDDAEVLAQLELVLANK
jgi:phage/plasmid-like protein (TIGR03299 family)